MENRQVNLFEQVPKVELNRNSFDRNHTYKTTLNAGYLYPVLFDEVLPGDTKTINTTFFGRLATPICPFMDNVYLDYHLFFVPDRLTWDNFQKFMGEQTNPGDSIDYLEPKINSGEQGFDYESLFDYMSITPKVPNLDVNARFFRAYNMIWNRFYRDENLQPSVVENKGDGPDNASDYTLLPRGKRSDYFTSCLPYPQKGPGVELPLGGSAPVIGNGKGLGIYSIDTGNGSTLLSMDGSQNYLATKLGGSATSYRGDVFGVSTNPEDSGLVADLSSATSATINSLRQAIALQQFLEKDMLSGTRYQELVLGHFGVMVPDFRLQYPEYIGGSTTRLNVNPVAQTSSTDTTTPQGNLAGYGTIASTGNGFTKSFTEHGIIIGLVSIRADLTYQQGIDRMFLRNTRYDRYWPTLAHLGEQSVYNAEIYAQGANVVDENGDIVDNKTFGYQERYAEYKYKNSYITGRFRSSFPQSLDYWHLAQNFTNLPVLNDEFIVENPDIDRVIAVPDEPQFLLDVYHDQTDIRPIPIYSTPGLGRI